jgi:hypothetical protein
MRSFTINSWRNRSGRYEYRVTIDNRTWRSGTVASENELLDTLDAEWDSVIARIRSLRKQEEVACLAT